MCRARIGPEGRLGGREVRGARHRGRGRLRRGGEVPQPGERARGGGEEVQGVRGGAGGAQDDYARAAPAARAAPRAHRAAAGGLPLPRPLAPGVRVRGAEPAAAAGGPPGRPGGHLGASVCVPAVQGHRVVP
eukprot:scaffold1704_cov246-Pinguiococcus_pyrenoidosus.AAC.12